MAGPKTDTKDANGGREEGGGPDALCDPVLSSWLTRQKTFSKEKSYLHLKTLCPGGRLTRSSQASGAVRSPGHWSRRRGSWSCPLNLWKARAPGWGSAVLSEVAWRDSHCKAERKGSRPPFQSPRKLSQAGSAGLLSSWPCACGQWGCWNWTRCCQALVGSLTFWESLLASGLQQ